jgi:hypothetical protein
MRTIKFVVFGLLVLAILEANAYPLLPHPLARAALAGVFLAYGLYTLLLFRKPAAGAVTQTSAAPSSNPAWPDLARLVTLTVFLLVFRIAFMFCAFAYLAQSLSGYDSTILAPGSRHDFVSFLLGVFDQTFPPLTALSQFFVPDWRPVTWNYGNTLALLLRLAAYFLFVVVLVSVVRHVWRLRDDIEELSKRVKIGNRRYSTG